MKRIFRVTAIVLVVLIAAFFALRAFTKSKSPEATAAYKQNGLNVEVKYCQPAKKDRELFGKLLPYGKVWRTGANEATIINFEKPVSINGKALAAGSYSLWTIPNPKEWTIIFNKQTGQWGTMYDEKQDILRVNAPASEKPELTEIFTISFVPDTAGAKMLLVWDKTQVTVPVALAKN
ncbi:MAG: DUF2911 domain-containing protein [Verrucomicrobia bacterium]|nr:DUF2911 domain-containing protein [Cytophagales bacterium]